MKSFKIESNFKPSGDQITAIDSLVKGLENKNKYQTLLGVTASGKTFTIANVIEKANRPTLVMSHNKTLAAQLYRELKDFFPNNAVEYFVSYYDYYQPEAYVPAKDLYIDKDASVNDEIDRLRLKATTSLLERRDVIIVASVSCIYGLGSPEDYRKLYIAIEKDGEYDRDEIIEKLVSIQYERVKDVLERARFKVMGDTLEIMSAYSDEVIRVEFFGDTVERIIKINPITRQKIAEQDRVVIYPAKHFVTGGDKLAAGIKLIEEELEEQYNKFKSEGKLVEAERI
ncbi:DEAD/DEAH box helicase family protein, partial [Brachyspira pilosicoli]